ncbi:PadR family transcriptional regulator [Aldersonia kunmingensis]|uniref:PadR family transcriptional regulator n=1 Tax=Aldersonia kunmingensis TaxID=408066 RepID=UPI00083351E4|nr:PadR family transcriptional regulator [Aldersonia kunmingensis]
MAGRSRTARSNPLALAVLVLLYERPMHPYQMSQTLRERGKQDSVRLNFGSLYSVVESLVRQELIEATGTEQEGNRPARTVYDLTEAGAQEAREWMRDLVGTPVKEYPQFMAALSFIAVLSPTEATELLHARAEHIGKRLAELNDQLAEVTTWLPELFVIESRYEAAMAQAELAFTEQLAQRIETGSLAGTATWQKLHDRIAETGAHRLSDAELEFIADGMGVPTQRGQ